MDNWLIGVIVLALVLFILFRQCSTRHVNKRYFLLPATAAAYVVWRVLSQPTTPDLLLVLANIAIGLTLGLAAGLLIKVWRDPTSGLVYQYGGWRYAGILVALIALRVLIRALLPQWFIQMGASAISDAVLGMAVGVFLGRTVYVGLRAAALAM